MGYENKILEKDLFSAVEVEKKGTTKSKGLFLGCIVFFILLFFYFVPTIPKEVMKLELVKFRIY